MFMRYIILALLFLKGNVSAQVLAIQIPVIPERVLTEGMSLTYYEIQLANLSTEQVKITEIRIMDDNNSNALLMLSGEGLYKRLGTNVAEPVIDAGSSAVVFLEVPLENEGVHVARLRHEIKYADLNGRIYTQGITASLSKKKPVLLDAPLKDGNWAAVYDPFWVRGHRRVYYAVDDTLRLPGRYAIDFIKLDDAGHFAQRQPDLVRNWYGYATDVLAVSDGIIALALDGFKESKTLSGHPRYTSSEATGNYISLKIADSVYVFYEHLQPGSIKVKAGDRVRAGQVIASVGFTGQSTGPHLHFHVADRNSPLGAEGISYAFRSFTYLGIYQRFKDFGIKRWEPYPTERDSAAQNERPLSNSIIKFQNQKSD